MRGHIHTLFLFLLVFCSIRMVAQSLPCNGDHYFSKVLNGKTSFYRFNSVAPVYELVSEQTLSFNGMGFNPADNYIYAIHGGSEMVRIDVNGQLTSLGPINGLTPDNYWAADFSPGGEYVLTGGASKIARISVSGSDAIVLSVSEKYYINGSGNGNPNIGDIAFDATTGICYGFDSNTRRLAAIDPVTGAVDAFGSYQPDISVVGAMYSDVYGRLHGFVFNEIYDIDKDSGAFTYRGDAPFNEGGIDACACPYYVDLEKEVSRSKACAGDTIAYTFYITNSSQKVLMGLDFTDTLPEPLKFVLNPTGLSGGLLAPNSGQGYSHVAINNMTLSPGVTVFSLLVEIPEDITQSLLLFNQARLTGFSSSLLPGEVLSDDPRTGAADDPTALEIARLPVYSVSIQNPGPLCAGDTLVLHASAPEPGSYQWTFPDGSLENTPSVEFPGLEPGQAGLYRVQFTSESGCQTDTVTEVSINPFPYLDLGPDTAWCLTSPGVLYPGDFQQYQWQDGSVTDRLYIAAYGTYAVTVANQYGCTSSDTIQVLPGCPAEVYTPNAFSPNGDGINDLFFAYALEEVEFQMWIFDRWGELVFESMEMERGWDGTFRGKDMPVGVYVYRLALTFLNGQTVRKSGDVLLLR